VRREDARNKKIFQCKAGVHKSNNILYAFAMLTRLKVSGFKNLLDVDVRFGPFTCIAGANGAGKSNLFDAIRFLSALAGNQTLIEAARAVRDEHGKNNDIRSLFHHTGDKYENRMSFEVEMLVQPTAVDDYGQIAKAQDTFLSYRLDLGWRNGSAPGNTPNPLEILHEELKPIRRAEAEKYLLFEHDAKRWGKSVVTGASRARQGNYFISTQEPTNPDESRTIRVHQDRGAEPKKDKSGKGPARGALAAALPKTILSSAQAAESPTALCACREMQSWRLLQLEPAELRQHDEFLSRTEMTSTGLHLPATLHRLASKGDAAAVYCRVANRLSELIGDVKSIKVESDKKHETHTIFLKGKDGTPHAARALSDGTLRFLALTVLELDTDASGLICLEEPENGIHPDRIPAILKLLKEIATNPKLPVGSENPLRQVIINTHSPMVVASVPDDSLLLAKNFNAVKNKKPFSKVTFCAVRGTWRVKNPSEKIGIVNRGDVVAYLNPIGVIKAAAPTEYTPPDSLVLT
jgi:predicted ATPase